jgi:hypothetical protein
MKAHESDIDKLKRLVPTVNDIDRWVLHFGPFCEIETAL